MSDVDYPMELVALWGVAPAGGVCHAARSSAGHDTSADALSGTAVPRVQRADGGKGSQRQRNSMQ